MPKPAKQQKVYQLRDTAEDPVDSSEANANTEHAASANSSSPEFSYDALLKHIATVVAEEGTRTQTKIQQVFSSFESILEEKVDSLLKRIDKVTAATDSLTARQTELETRVSALEDDVTPLKKKLTAMEKVNAELTAKITDLEGRSRRDNIRILNLKESTEGSDPVSFFEGFIPKVLGLPVQTISIDRAHRSLGPPVEGRPRPVIVKIHRSRDVSMIWSAARRKGTIQHEDQAIRFAPDIPPLVRSARTAFNPVCTELIKRNIRFQMIFPAVLSFRVNGVQKSFKEPEDAKTFLDDNV